MNIYIDDPERKLSIRGNRLVISDKEKNDISEMPIGHINNLYINKHVQITSQAICKLCEEGINISWFSGNRFICQTHGYNTENIIKEKNQFELLDNGDYKLKLAKKNIYAKIANQLDYIGKNSLFNENDISKASCSDELMGTEGAYASLYFSELKNKFDEKYKFNKRIKHPCTDPVNSVLSFLYSMLYREFVFIISQHGLNSSIGFFHKLRNGHCALSSDLMESLRCELCDKIAVKIFEDKIYDDDFITTEDGEIYISKRLRNIIITEFHQKLENKIFTQNGFANDFTGLINYIVCSYEKALKSKEAEEFRPFLRSDYFA